MPYARIYLDHSPELFTWSVSKEISVGDRVLVPFRNTKRFGIVIEIDDVKPDFAVRSILSLVGEGFFPPYGIEVAKQLSVSTMSSLPKVLSLMIPDAFLWKEHPEKRNTKYFLGKKGEREEGNKIRGEKQKAVVEALQKQDELSDDEIRELASLATIKSLLEKGVIEKENKGLVVPRPSVQKKKQLHTLTDEQESVYKALKKDSSPTLLWGVTGSGKTEVYRHLARDILDGDPTAQVLFLVPEIALTEQFICSFQEVFGDTLAVWHSQLSEGERIQEWARVTTGEARILVGARSACMIPLRNPKLLVIDEEHEWTYKNEFVPRFWTHDVIQEIREQGNNGIKVILGTATPSLRTLKKVDDGEYKVLRLNKRVHSEVFPKIEIVDLRNEGKKGNFTALSEILVEDIQAKIANKEQVVLFLNKRGMAGATQCKDCGHQFECKNCSYNLKLHEKGSQALLMCHVCGHMEHLPPSCPECHQEAYVFRGWGTQQVEKQLQELFPKARIARVDRDSVKKKHDFQKIYQAMHNREIDILLGTQMVAKGLDFAHVGLVGVLLADIGLGLPDFAAEERVFQLMLQVAGRAGRRNQPSHILVQTFHPEEPLFSYLQKYNIDEFYELLQTQRKALSMPPYKSLAKITYSYTKKEDAHKHAKALCDWLKEKGIDSRMAPAFFPRSHNKYHWHVFVQHNEQKKLLELLHSVPKELLGKVDTDPVSLL